jgi:methionine aminopeptidase
MEIGSNFALCPALQIAEAYGCQMVEGVLSHQMKQFVIDANKCVLNRPSSEARVEEGEFEENEVYAVDIVVSTGEGKTRVRSCLGS